MKTRTLFRSAAGIGLLVFLVTGCAWRVGCPKSLDGQIEKVKGIEINLNEWQPYMAVDPDDTIHVFRVSWDDSVKYCRIVFRNEKKRAYRLVAPWLKSVEIERPVGFDVTIDQIVIDSMPSE